MKDTADIDLRLPARARGRLSATARQEYDAALEAWCHGIKQLRSRLDFSPSVRGWCYILEEYGLLKSEFDGAERLITQCRKAGLLPLDITAKDGARETTGLQVYIDREGPEEWAESVVRDIADKYQYYNPLDFWEGRSVYVEMFVEKIDLKSLFEPVCEEYLVPLSNARGWADVHSRADLMERMRERESQGAQCVLLYCGDHDPGGLNISGILHENLADLKNAVGWNPANLIIERFGLSREFIEEQGLPWIDNLVTSNAKGLDLSDPKHPDHHKNYVQSYLREFGARKCEANTLVLRPDAGRQLCREAIRRYISDEDVRKYWRSVSALQGEVRALMPEVLRRYVEENPENK